jgi:hypothetical protein
MPVYTVYSLSGTKIFYIKKIYKSQPLSYAIQSQQLVYSISKLKNLPDLYHGILILVTKTPNLKLEDQVSTASVSLFRVHMLRPGRRGRAPLRPRCLSPSWRDRPSQRDGHGDRDHHGRQSRSRWSQSLPDSDAVAGAQPANSDGRSSSSHESMSS